VRLDAPVATSFGPEVVRAQFPIFAERPYGRPLVYLDSAATSHKPERVLAAIGDFYRHHNANVHRGLHWLSERATEDYEGARVAVAAFLGAAPDEVVFTRSTTEAINLVAQSWGRTHLREGDEILVTEMEHHSNIVPWQLVAAERGARLVVAPIDECGAIDLEAFEARLGPRTRLVALTHLSNVLGTVNPVARLAEAAHRAGALVLVDGAQAAPHLEIDVAALGADFYALSGHKMYGPTGIGVLFGRRELLAEMPPYQGGGDMIRSVSFEGTTFAPPPQRFEAGTPHLAGAVGLAAAIDFLDEARAAGLAAAEAALFAYARESLASIAGLRLVGAASEQASLCSFLLDAAHPHDIGTILDRRGIAIRAGHHCAQPLMARLGCAATARASFGCYTTRGDVDALVEGIGAVQEAFG
jgi:cysteine desulfurase / selenocysteine lyase